MGYKESIEKLHEILNDLEESFNKFPDEERVKKHFDNWTLREVIIHLNGWNELTADNIENLLNGNEIPYIDDLDSFNQDIIEESADLSFNQIVQDFSEMKVDLLNGYRAVPLEMIHIPIWEGEDDTIASWVDIGIKHHTEHLDQIKDVMDNFNQRTSSDKG